MHATCEKFAIYASLESFLRRALVVIEAVALVWKYVRFVKSQSGSDFGFNSGFIVRSIILPTCRGLVLYQFYKTRTFRPLGSGIQGYKLRQVSGINYLIPMITYRLPCGDSEITWVG